MPTAKSIEKTFGHIKGIIKLAITNPKTTFGVLVFISIIVFLITNPQILARNEHKNETTKINLINTTQIIKIIPSEASKKLPICELWEENRGEYSLIGCSNISVYKNGSTYFINRTGNFSSNNQ